MRDSRRRQVLNLLLEGYSENEIASRLRITVHTVRLDTKAICERNRVTHPRELGGLLAPESADADTPPPAPSVELP